MRNYDHYRRIIHPLIALGVPAGFLISFVLLSAELYRSVFDTAPGFMTGLYLVLPGLSLLSGLTAVVFGNIFQTERINWTTRVRELMILSLVVYSFASLFRGDGAPARFAPAPGNVLPVLYAAGQWFVSVRLQNALRDRELLALELEGKDGDALYSGMREAGIQPEAALKALQRLRWLSTFFAVALLVLLTATGNKGLPLSLPTIISVILFFLMYLFILALCSQYGFEQYAAGAGLREENGQRSARLRFAGMVLFFAGGAGFLLGGNGTLIPTAWIASVLGRFGLWLKTLIPGGGIGIRINTDTDLPSGEGMRQLLPQVENGIDLTGILDTLNRFTPVALGFLVVLFLLAPLLSKKYRVLLARHSLKDFLFELRTLFRKWLGKNEEAGNDGIRLDPDHLNEVRKRLQSLAGAHKTRARWREFGRVSRAFLALIRWGKRQGIVFTAVSAPGSYTAKLAERFPAQQATLTTVADAFEQAVYSPYPLGKERLREYERAIRMIIRTP